MQVQKYIVLFSTTLEGLTDLVNAATAKGATLQGGIATAGGCKVSMFMQAVYVMEEVAEAKPEEQPVVRKKVEVIKSGEGGLPDNHNHIKAVNENTGYH